MISRAKENKRREYKDILFAKKLEQEENDRALAKKLA